MNYIRHINAFYNHVKKDDRLTSSHISLYLALFQYWNYNRFQNPFPIYRDNMMQLSRIGSKNTYHKCIKQLHEANYIFYHSPVSKFQPIKISMIRLDQKEEPSTCKQLNFFNPSAPESLNPTQMPPSEPSPPQWGEDLGVCPIPMPPTEPSLPPLGGDLCTASCGEGGWAPGVARQCPNISTVPVPILTAPCPKNDTVSVPILTAICPKNDTVPVPKMGQNIKLNILKNKTVCNTPTKIFTKNQKLSEAINNLAGVPELTQLSELPLTSELPLASALPLPSALPLAFELPLALAKGLRQTDIESFFLQNNYPSTEAQKFFYYNQSRGWMLKDKVPIQDWQSLAHKWMLGVGKQNEEKNMHVDRWPDAQELFKRLAQGQNIFKLIKIEHFNQLQLELDDATILIARKERINQLTGSNQNSILQLLKAYLDNKKDDLLIIKDEENLISLAKRIAVLKHLNSKKQ